MLDRDSKGTRINEQIGCIILIRYSDIICMIFLDLLANLLVRNVIRQQMSENIPRHEPNDTSMLAIVCSTEVIFFLFSCSKFLFFRQKDHSHRFTFSLAPGLFCFYKSDVFCEFPVKNSARR